MLAEAKHKDRSGQIGGTESQGVEWLRLLKEEKESLGCQDPNLFGGEVGGWRV